MNLVDLQESGSIGLRSCYPPILHHHKLWYKNVHDQLAIHTIHRVLSHSWIYCPSTICSITIYTFYIGLIHVNIVMQDYLSALKLGRVIRVTFSPGHPGLTRIGSREKRKCSFDDVELINAIA